MADYPVDEQLTRLIALERMKRLSDLYVEALKAGDRKALASISVERQQLKKEFITVVK